MSFVWPHLLWLALVVPVLAVVEHLLARRGERPDDHPNIRRGVAAGGRVRFDRGPGSAAAPAWRLWLAVLLIVVALARPQWGRVEAAAGGDAPGEVLIAVDLSRSMLADDVSPSRLERARALATRLAEDLPDQRVGLIGFAGSAYVLAPASEDRAILRAYLPRMRPEHMPEPGSNFAALLDVALAAFSPTEQGRALVVLSDGEAEPGPWQDRLVGLQRRHIQVIAVGLGSEGGALAPGFGGGPLRTRAGEPVVTRLNPAALQAMASATGGRYLDAAGARDLADLARVASARPPATSGQAMAEQAAQGEQYAWFVAAALALIAWSAVAEFTARPRLRLRPRTAVAQVAVAALLLAGQFPAASRAAGPLLTETDLQGEKDPLHQMEEVVAAILRKREPGPPDYLQVAEAAVRYGEVHRSHDHALQEGVLRDGIAAVEAGRRLDPTAADWERLKARLDRLLEPPPLVPPDPGPADPANEPTGAKGAAPIAGEDARDSRGEAANQEKKAPTAGEQGLRNVGGGERDVYDPAEWRNPALVHTLAELQRLRREDSPAELFARMHAGATQRAAREQTW